MSYGNTKNVMRQIKVFIEKGKKCGYSAYMPDDNNLPFGLIGIGETALEAEADFRSSYEDIKNLLKNEGKCFDEELEFVFTVD